MSAPRFRRLPLTAVVAAAAALAGAATAGAVASPATAPAAVSTSVAEPPSSGDRAVFQPLAPMRLVDTRIAAQGPALAAKAERQVQVTGVGGVPADALAVVVNVTAIKPTKPGYFTVWPTGAARPTASNVNFLAGQVVPNLATVKLGTGGKVSVLNMALGTTHLVVDLAGYYQGHAHDDRYLPKAQAQARTAAGAFTCAGGTILRAVAADGAPTCVTDADTTYTAGAGLLLDNGVFSAEQRRSAANAFTCVAGTYLRAVAADGAPTCAPDQDTNTTYTAGAGLLLTGGVFSAEQRRSAANAFTCPVGQYLRAVAADGAPTCVPDSAGPSYDFGFGLLLDGATVSAEQGRSAKFAMTCEPGSVLEAIAADGAPTCAEHALRRAGSGLWVDEEGALHAEQGRSAPGAFTCAEGHYLRAVAADGTPSCAPDVDTNTDTNTTYTAGNGLVLTGTTFSVAEGTSVVRVRGDSANAATNGTALRSALAALPFTATPARPIVVVLAPGTYDLGTGVGSVLVLPDSVSLVGSGRESTVLTGSYGAGSDGLVRIVGTSTLASLTVRNVHSAVAAAVAAVVVQSGNARLHDVAAVATASAAGTTAFGVVSFSGGNTVIERSTVQATSSQSTAYGLYAVAATIRGTGADATAGTQASAAYAAAAGSGATIELTNSALKATSVSGSAYVAAELGGSDVVRVAHTKLTGTLLGTPTCVGAYDEAFAPRAC